MNIFKWFFNSLKRMFTSQKSEADAMSYSDKPQHNSTLDMGVLINQIKKSIDADVSKTKVGYRIKQEVNKYSTANVKRAASDLKLSDVELNKCKIDSDVYHNLSVPYIDKANELIERDKREVMHLHANLLAKEDELNRFKQKNKLERTAHYPSPLGYFLKSLLLFVLIIVEGVANSAFFAEGSDLGLLGGFISAFVCASLNVVVAFSFGFKFIRFVNHINPFKKLFGALATVISILLMITFALGIAHYRNAMIDQAINPAKTALETFIDQPLGLGDMMGWLLFGISLLFAIIALFDGLSMTDSYPGYGKIAKNHDKAKKEFDDLSAEIHDEIVEIKEDFSRKIDAFYSQTQHKLKQYATFLNRKKELKKRFDADNYQIETACKALLESYEVQEPWDDYLPSHVEKIEWKIEEDEMEYQKQLNAFGNFKEMKVKVLSEIQSTFQKNYGDLTTVIDVVNVNE